ASTPLLRRKARSASTPSEHPVSASLFFAAANQKTILRTAIGHLGFGVTNQPVRRVSKVGGNIPGRGGVTGRDFQCLPRRQVTQRLAGLQQWQGAVQAACVQ